MKKVIVNNKKIRLTANGHSIVEGSFARVTEIRGKSVVCQNLITSIVSGGSGDGYCTYGKDKDGGFLVEVKKGFTARKIEFFATTLDAGTYTLSGCSKNSLGISLKIKGDSGYLEAEDKGNGITFTVENTIEDCKIYVVFTKGFSEAKKIKLYPMLNIGDTALPFQPYFEGIKDAKISEILSHNRNLLSKKQSVLITDVYAGSAYLSKDLLDLINSIDVNTFTMSSSYKSNKQLFVGDNPRCGFKLTSKTTQVTSNNISFKPTYNAIKQERKVTFQFSDLRPFGDGVFWFNDFGTAPYGTGEENSFVATKNQVEIGNNATRYVESEEYTYKLPTELTLRSSIERPSVYDVYYPEQGIIFRLINADGTIKEALEIEEIKPVAFNGYKAFNNGYELLKTSLDASGFSPYDFGAIPEIIVEYEVEEKQGADRTRFDFITLDGEAICGIGYEKLKSTNQLQYVEEPSRQNDGSMQNIEDYETFVLPALEIGFNCINEETYRRLKHKLISKRTFDVGYYDKDLDKVVTMEMYVKPIDLDNFLSRGDEIIGMNSTLSFIPTLNEETKFKVEFFNADMTENIVFDGDKGVMYGRSIETPELPSGYNYWLMIDSGFEENTFVKVKGKKKLSIFGDTKLIAVK